MKRYNVDGWMSSDPEGDYVEYEDVRGGLRVVSDGAPRSVDKLCSGATFRWNDELWRKITKMWELPLATRIILHPTAPKEIHIPVNTLVQPVEFEVIE